MKAVREEEVELRGIVFVKHVGFKPGWKERGEMISQITKQLKASVFTAV